MKTEKKKKKAAPAVGKTPAKAETSSAKKAGKSVKSRKALKTTTGKTEKITIPTSKKTPDKPQKITGGGKANKTGVRGQPASRIKKAEKKKRTRPVATKTDRLSEEVKTPGKVPELPEEYGENRLFLIVVDPKVVYYGWEIKKEDIPERKGDLTLRIFDVTGTGPETVSSDTYVDLRLNGRVGSGFIEIRMHGREIIAELGVNCKGRKYRAILRSCRVSMPELLTLDELGIAGKLFESGIPLGY